MSLEIEFRSGTAALSIPINSDTLVVEALRKTLPEAVALVFDCNEPGTPEPIDSNILKSATSAIRAALRLGVVPIPAVFKFVNPTGGVIGAG